MSDGSSYADIIILALIAGFILLRLRSVLGDKTGNDKPSYFAKSFTSATEKQEPIVQLGDKSLKSKVAEEDTYMVTVSDNSITDVINAIKAKDPQFTGTYFLGGAKAAFEMVFDAFAKGDAATIKRLMADSLYQEFNKEILARDTQDTWHETTLVSVQAKDITKAVMNGNVAQLTVHFASEQVSVTRDKANQIVGGNASEIHHAEDHWVFERDVTSKNPNWKIIET